MRAKIPIETPRTIAAVMMAVIAALGMTGALAAIFTYLGWVAGLRFVANIGSPFFFLLYGACAVVLSHHLTHHPAGLINYLAKGAAWVLILWALTREPINAISLLFGVAAGFAWLHWIHHIGERSKRNLNKL